MWLHDVFMHNYWCMIDELSDSELEKKEEEMWISSASRKQINYLPFILITYNHPKASELQRELDNDFT